MKTKDKQAIRAKTVEELKLLLKEARDALYVLKLEMSQNKLKNLRSIFWKRKEIAIVTTLINEKEPPVGPLRPPRLGEAGSEASVQGL